PLLCEVDALNKGYEISHTWTNNIISNFTTSLSESVSSLAFMDDTNWIVNSQQNLEDILAIADNFYDLTRMVVIFLMERFIPLDRSLKPEYRLDDNSSFMSFYDLNINPSDSKREYVIFWNPITNTNVYRQITRKHLHIETADIHHFNLISNDLGLGSLVKCPGCSLN
ncbi:14183_t:CDS:2, partial [Funneliformis geosporum]